MPTSARLCPNASAMSLKLPRRRFQSPVHCARLPTDSARGAPLPDPPALASRWPSVSGADLYSIAAPAAQWDAVPTAAKLQILGFIGLLELWGEGQMSPHYLKGGKPGAFPSFALAKETIGHPLFDLYDPFGFSKNKTPEQKERGLLVEINNGRAAMIGIFGFISAASVEGSVPALSGLIAHYDGETMAPFSAVDSSLPFVTQMLAFPHLDSWSKMIWW